MAITTRSDQKDTEREEVSHLVNMLNPARQPNPYSRQPDEPSEFLKNLLKGVNKPVETCLEKRVEPDYLDF